MTAIQSREDRIPTARGEVYSKSWSSDTAVSGRAAPIVLLHDSLGCVDLWRDFPERLAAVTGRTVVAYDRIGFGRSVASSGHLPLTFVQDEATSTFKTVIDHLRVDRFVAFGHSVGGGMAIEIAGQFPRACEALITESAQAFVEERTREGIRQAQRNFALPGQLDRLRKYHGDKAEWVLNAWIDTWLSPQFANWSIEQTAGKILCPLLAVHGQNDEYGSIIHPTRIAMQSKGESTVEIVPECGHVPHREHPATVLDLVSGFLRARVQTVRGLQEA